MVFLDNPDTDFVVKTLIAIRKKPNICIIPDNVRRKENSPSENNAYTITTKITKPT